MRCSLLMVSAATLACAAEPDAWSLAPAGHTMVVAPDSSHIFELVRVIGPDVLPADFTYLGPAGISASGKVALRSHADCRVAIIDLATGALERVFGRCGDGPHESRTIVALMWSGDTLIVVDASSGRFRWFGAADTAVRSVRPDAGALGGSSGLSSVAIVDDTTALLFLRLQPASVVSPGHHGLVAEMHLLTGAIRRRYFEEPEARRSVDAASQRYYRGCAAGGDRVAIENNGPPELIRVDREGGTIWARGTPTTLVGLVREPVGDGASFRWGRLPRPVACGNEAMVSLIVPIEGNSAAPSSGRVVALDWDGRTLLNQSIPAAAYPLAFAGWHGRDSLFVAAVSQATTPHAAVFRLRPRRAGETGPFLIPDSVKAIYTP